MNYLEELSNTVDALDMMQLFALEKFVRDCQGTLWLAGNGGSASTAQHWACDLSKAAGRRVQALGSNPAVLTAYANDDGYDQALARELRTVTGPGDALIALSCSGRSPNILALLGAAQRYSMPYLMITGKNAPTYPDIPAMVIPHTHYGILEDCFGTIGHWLTEALCNT